MTTDAPTLETPRRSPKRLLARGGFAVIPVLLVALLVYGVVAQSPNRRIDDALANGRTAAAPGFALDVLQHGRLGPSLTRRLKGALQDGRVDLRELRGVPVVLNFWASWCVPCREEAPLLERVWRTQARPQQVLFVGLDMQDVRGDAFDFLHEFRVDYLNIRDRTNETLRRYGATGIPETFFISPAGRVVAHVIGVSTEAQLRQGLAAVRAGTAVSARRGGAERPAR